MNISPEFTQNEPKSSSPHPSFLSSLRPRHSHEAAKQDQQNANTTISSVILKLEWNFRPSQSVSSQGVKKRQSTVTSNIIKPLIYGNWILLQKNIPEQRKCKMQPLRLFCFHSHRKATECVGLFFMPCLFDSASPC